MSCRRRDGALHQLEGADSAHFDRRGVDAFFGAERSAHTQAVDLNGVVLRGHGGVDLKRGLSRARAD